MCSDFAAPETVPWWAMARSTCRRRRSITGVPPRCLSFRFTVSFANSGGCCVVGRVDEALHSMCTGVDPCIFYVSDIL